MKIIKRKRTLGMALFISSIIAAVAVQAAPNENAGNNKGRGDEKSEAASRNAAHFDDHHRTIVMEYFAGEMRKGNCPPGLAKKNNGCSPPGQAKQWQLGQALPRGINYYDLPSALLAQLGAPPAGYYYAGVDDDVLLLELGTQLVVDVVNALSQ